VDILLGWSLLLVLSNSISRIKPPLKHILILRYQPSEVPMPNQFKFTSTKLKQLPSTPKSSRSTETEYSDTEAPGLKLLVGKTGNKRFLFRYTFNKAKRSISLGRYPDVSINAAREQARAHRQCLNEGYDPREKRVTAFPTIQQFFYDTYLPLAKNKKRTWNDDEARFRLHCSSIAEQLMDIPNVATKVSLLPCNNPRHRYCTLDETQRIINAALAYPNKAVYPKRELLPKKVTTFIEFLTDSLN